MSGWLKAGLIGAAVLVLLNLIGLIPFAGCITLPLTILAYGVIGGLAASYLPPVRAAGQGAGHGALAALVAALVGGIVGLIIAVIQASLGGTAQILSQLPSETLRTVRDSGIPPIFLAGIGGSVCCGVGMLIAAALGAIGGAIFAAAKPD